MTIQEYNKEIENLRLLDGWWDLAAKKVEIQNLIQIEREEESSIRLRLLFTLIQDKINKL